jgi:PAS domain S-box-containing protein
MEEIAERLSIIEFWRSQVKTSKKLAGFEIGKMSTISGILCKTRKSCNMNRQELATQIQTLRTKLKLLERSLPEQSQAIEKLSPAIAELTSQLDQFVKPDTALILTLGQEPSEELWRALSDCLPVGIFTADREGRCAYINPRCQEIVGCTLEESLGEGWLNLVHPEDRDRVLKPWLVKARNGLPHADEFRVITDQGEIRWLYSRSAPMRSNGSLIGHTGTIEDITKQKQAEAQIKASLQEKEALLKEIHHRVKNNLQIISSLIYLQTQRIEDPKARQVFEDSQSRISSMALVHDSLYRSENFASIDLSDYIQALTASLFQTYRIRPELVTLNVQVDPGVVVTLDKAIPCGLILNELMTNALKHGFPSEQKGIVAVKLDRIGEQVCLTVENDGNTLPESFELKKIQSMGLKLVSALVSQIQGQLAVENAAETRFKITFNGS